MMPRRYLNRLHLVNWLEWKNAKTTNTVSNRSGQMLHYISLTKKILDRAVSGVGIKPGPLRRQFNPEKPVLMVFLRHIGCQFCKETVRDVRAASQRDPDYPDVLFFFQENLEEGQAFFNTHWPRARAVSDPDQFFYKEFGIPAAGILDVVGPRALLSSIRATLKGNLNSWPRGNIWQMPGFFVVLGDQVVWSHDYSHAGDAPPLRRISRFLESLTRKTGSKPESRQGPNLRPLHRVG